MLNISKGVIDIDKLLEEKFNYHYNGNLLDLYSSPFIEMEGNGADAMFWIIVDNERYLFKSVYNYECNIWGELLSSKLAKKLGIPCVEYRYATFGNLNGVICKSMINDDEKLVLGCEIMQKFFNKNSQNDDAFDKFIEKFNDDYNIPTEIRDLNLHERGKKLFRHINNLEDVWSIIDNVYESKKNLKEIVRHLLKMIIFDIVSLQYDRHPNNWGVIERDGKYSPCPLFDNSTSFGVHRLGIDDEVNSFKLAFFDKTNRDNLKKSIYYTSIKFTLSSDDIYDKSLALDILRKILDNSSAEDKKEIIKLIEKVDEDLIDKIIAEVEEENGIAMENDIYFYIYNMMSIHIQNMNNVIKDYRDELYEVKKH